MDSAKNDILNNMDDLTEDTTFGHHQDDLARQEVPLNIENPDDSEDSNYLPLSEEEASLEDDDSSSPKTL